MSRSVSASMESSPNIWPVIIEWAKGTRPSEHERQLLLNWTIDPEGMLNYWPTGKESTSQNVQQVTVQQVSEHLDRRADLLQSVVSNLHQKPLPLSGDWTRWIIPLWTFWLPLAEELNQRQRACNEPFIQGILGGQGTGKTTLTRVLNHILSHLGQHSVGLSIDDIYLSYARRLALQQTDPRLIWRGPPGTHDISLGLQTLQQIKSARPTDTVRLPRFDKSLHGGQGDRTTPLTVQAPTIVLFEGWFVGARPVQAATFTADCQLPEPIVNQDDRQFAADCNHRLESYLPLWDFLDSLIVLEPVDYRLSQQWRSQAEQDMKAQGKSGLSDQEITEFVTYFWKALHPELFITPLTCPSNAKCSKTFRKTFRAKQSKADLVVTLNEDHSLRSLYRPE